MRSQLLTILTGLAAVVTAHPGSALFERQACNNDNCLRAVRGQAGASDSCASFLQKTSTLCGATVTATSLSTTTVATSTTTSVLTSGTLTSSVTSASTTTVAGTTSTVTVTSTGVAAGTATIVTYTTSIVTAATATVTSTTTLSAVPTGPGGPGSPGQPGKVKRQAACTTTVGSATTVPAFASASCKASTSRFSSACSCFGVTRGLPDTTVTSGTVTSTSISTVRVTATSTSVTTSAMATVTVTARPTVTVTSTLITTTTSVLAGGPSATTTSTSTVFSTTAAGTTTVTQTVQPSSGTFMLVLPGGRKVGINTSDNSLVPVEGGINGATFSLNQFGYLQSSTLTFGVNAVTGGPDTVFGFATTPRNPLVCTLSNPPNRGALICRVSASERFFSLCNNKVVLANSFQQSPCAAIDLQAV